MPHNSSSREVLAIIKKAAKAQDVDFHLHRKGKAHDIYHLGETVVLPIQRSIVPNRIKFEMFKQCEVELGHRWWMPENRRVEAPDELPCTVQKGFRGPRGKRS